MKQDTLDFIARVIRNVNRGLIGESEAKSRIADRLICHESMSVDDAYAKAACVLADDAK